MIGRNRSRSRSPLRVENIDEMNQPITSVEIQVLPKFSGDARELSLFLAICDNFYNRHANQDRTFLTDYKGN